MTNLDLSNPSLPVNSYTSQTYIAIPITVFVVFWVIIILCLILLTTIIIVLCIYIKRGKVKQEEPSNEYDDVIVTDTGIIGLSNPTEMSNNEAYGTCGHCHPVSSSNNLEMQPMEAEYEEIPY